MSNTTSEFNQSVTRESLVREHINSYTFMCDLEAGIKKALAAGKKVRDFPTRGVDMRGFDKDISAVFTQAQRRYPELTEVAVLDADYVTLYLDEKPSGFRKAVHKIVATLDKFAGGC